MENIHAGILALAGFGMVFIGNTLAHSGGLFAEMLGYGIGLFGDFLILYAIYKAVRWTWKKIRNK